ncbi:hypothetical protein ABBQ32_004245 [Trebouxia sp. C0010 RCD-2024]
MQYRWSCLQVSVIWHGNSDPTCTRFSSHTIQYHSTCKTAHVGCYLARAWAPTCGTSEIWLMPRAYVSSLYTSWAGQTRIAGIVLLQWYMQLTDNQHTPAWCEHHASSNLQAQRVLHMKTVIKLQRTGVPGTPPKTRPSAEGLWLQSLLRGVCKSATCICCASKPAGLPYSLSSGGGGALAARHGGTPSEAQSTAALHQLNLPFKDQVRLVLDNINALPNPKKFPAFLTTCSPQCAVDAKTKTSTTHPTFAECKQPLLAQWDHMRNAVQRHFADKTLYPYTAANWDYSKN